MSMTTPRVTVPVAPKGVSPVYTAAYDSIRKGAPGLSGATCAVIARSINMKVSHLSAAPAPEGGAVSDALQRLRVLRDQARNGTAITDPDEYDADELDNILSVIEPALATREEAPAEAGETFLSWLEREIDGASCDIGAAHQEGGTATESEKARLGILSDVRAEYLALRAQPPSREDAQPVGHFQHSATWDAWEEVSPEYAGSEGVVPLYRHPAPDALRVAVEALGKIAGWRRHKLSCDHWADTYSGGHSAALERCANVADQALTALQSEQKGGA